MPPHIPPGVTAEFKKKYEALSMVASYFTGTYGTNPWTEIDDAACLRCHERRLLAGKELFGDVLFDHTSHLAGMRRGKNLRCTSCHSQIVQGSHIAVTTSTCILCHFKDQTSNSGVARCTLCHPIPDKVIRHETLTLNHAEVGRFGMECTWCHARPAGSNGDVPKERCHLEILHVGPPRIEKATTACNTCHLKGHSPQMNLYAGIGGRGVDPMPDAMFLAGVRCDGCHLEIPGQATDTRGASDVSCMSCHGPSYRKIFLAWKEAVEKRTAGLERQMSQVTAALAGSAPEALANARFNLDLVRDGRGLHNLDYAYALLTKAHEDMNRARSERGLSTLPPPWPEIPYDSPCLRCHQGIESDTGTVFGRRFRHEPHVIRGGVDCSVCHRPHEERPEQEIVHIDAATCESCHHEDTAADCSTCHGGLRQRAVKSHLGEFSHAFHVDDLELECGDCHDRSVAGQARLDDETCTTCH
ncbi:MAG: cytochrome c3 family protein [Planctomycetota bacterium]